MPDKTISANMAPGKQAGTRGLVEGQRLRAHAGSGLQILRSLHDL